MLVKKGSYLCFGRLVVLTDTPHKIVYFCHVSLFVDIAVNNGEVRQKMLKGDFSIKLGNTSETINRTT